MATITIKNVGPVKEASFSLNKINVFMGPQSSGKSTIAKIISYCTWVEKRCLLDGEYKEDARKQLLNFHHLDEEYFDNNSSFDYESDFIKINYTGKNLKQEIRINESKILDYNKTKNIYIPAERNFVSVIPNLGKYNETNDNIMNLIYDWFTAKKERNKPHSLPILNLNVNYYYHKGTDSDMITLNSKKKDIPLNTGSSGLQSIIPLIVIIEYLTKNIYDMAPTTSIREQEYLLKLREKQNIIGMLDFAQQVVKRSYYTGTNFIIEEPEQNLFPETQRDLVYYLLKKLQSEREHTLTITTHSPYILYALNNCMMGGLVRSQLQGDEKNEYLVNGFLSEQSWIDPKLVSVWEIQDGELRTIQDKDNIISENYFDQKMTDLTDEYFQMLSYYKNEK